MSRLYRTEFFRAGDRLYRVSDVQYLNVSRLVDYRVTVKLVQGNLVDLTGPDAIELIMLLKPSALEGRRLRWVRHAWATHNLLGHPLMQILSFLDHTRIGVLIHEATIPRPTGDRRHV